MNVRLLFASAVLVLLSSCQTTAPAVPATPLDGAWEIVSATFTRPDRAPSTMSPPQIRSLKVLNDGRFSFVTIRQDGTLGRASAGRYSVNGNTYTETIELSDLPAAVGTTYTFTWRLQGDEWHHSGGAGDQRFDEVWRRVR